MLQLRNVSLTLGSKTILNQVNLQIEPQQRLCLVGPNGMGKSTLLQVIAGQLDIDSGERMAQSGLRIKIFAQQVPTNLRGNVFSIVAQGLGKAGKILSDFVACQHQMAQSSTASLPASFHALQQAMDEIHGWDLQAKVDSLLTRLKLNPEQDINALSGGEKRRVLLAAALISEPDLLLLDEPTNHLDIESIQWLEQFLKSLSTTLVLITHDRYFLQALATDILDLDHGQLTQWPADYNRYLELKDQLLETEQRQQALFDKKLAQEEAWLRQGIKARRTRNEGRVRALKKMREQSRQQLTRQSMEKLQTQQVNQSGQLVIEAKHLHFRYNDQLIIDDFSTLIRRGDKIGIVGPNGSGKTTLLNLLLEKHPPLSGQLRQGTQLQIAYFDQLRGQLDRNKSLEENITCGHPYVTFNQQSYHIATYLKQFLFSPDKLRQPVSILSGGEINRLLLAKLFTQPFNLLVMDEPTNDLDIATMDLLEELLSEFSGTLLLVSHDRAFLDNIVNRLYVFTGQGKIDEFIGGYSDWQQYQANRSSPATENKVRKAPAKTGATPTNKRKLGYKERRELNDLPQQIEILEKEQTTLQEQLADQDFCRQHRTSIPQCTARLKAIDTELATLYQRWENLEQQDQ